MISPPQTPGICQPHFFQTPQGLFLVAPFLLLTSPVASVAKQLGPVTWEKMGEACQDIWTEWCRILIESPKRSTFDKSSPQKKYSYPARHCKVIHGLFFDAECRPNKNRSVWKCTHLQLLRTPDLGNRFFPDVTTEHLRKSRNLSLVASLNSEPKFLLDVSKTDALHYTQMVMLSAFT